MKIKKPTKKHMIYCLVIVNLIIWSISYVKTKSFYNYYVEIMTARPAEAGQKERKKQKVYAHNQQVPVEIVKEEIRNQAKLFGLDEEFMLDLADCESGFNNLAKNKKSTACGVYQYTARTWQATESFRSNRIACTDHKANIREAMIDISNGEYFRWAECLESVE